MKIFNDLKEYINEDNPRIIIFSNKIYISKYLDIKSFDSNKFVLELKDKKIILNGKNISIKRLTKDELLINGEFDTIEFGWY